MAQGPLSEPRLAEIESRLNAGRFDEAQRLLTTIFDLPNAETVSAYFATRLLFQRGRLDCGGVILRLRELLTRVPDFPEAQRMLAAAEAGILEASPEIFRQVTGAPRYSQQAAPPIGIKNLSRHDIPRAPPLPRFTPRTGTPSYVPVTPEPPPPPGIASLRNTDRGVGPQPPKEPRLEVVRAGPLPKIPSLEIPALSANESLREAPRASGKPKLEEPLELQLSELEFDAPELVPLPARDPPSTQPAPPSQPPQALRASLSQRVAASARHVASSAHTLSTLPPPPDEAAPVSEERRNAITERPTADDGAALPAPSLFEIAAALDAGHPARALELSQRAGAEPGPELTLLIARALIALGEKDKAVAHLERLLRAMLIEPLVRAASARLLIEVGRPEQALAQARRAVDDDPEDPVGRATLVWALVRVARRSGDEMLGQEAESLLSTTRLREGAIAGLLLALRAALAAEFGDAKRAISLAQTALQQDPRQPDALAAIAVASARLGLRSDALRAQERLEQLNPDEAAANEQALLRHGVELELAEPPPTITLAESSALWGEAESALRAGQRQPALQALIVGCDDIVQKVSRRGDVEAWKRLARSAARLLTELPVFRHFAPFDCSVFSVERLEAGLSLLFDAPAQDASEAAELVLGAYVGECYRQAFAAEWHGAPSFPLSASIEGVGISTRPCERVRERLRHAAPFAIDAPKHLHPGADPLGNSVPLSLRPPAPWDPRPWPQRAEFVQLGRLLPSSVVGDYCAKILGLPLDRSVSGCIAIDRYVALLAPPKAPPDPDGAWIFRAGMLLAAYLGEVLVEAVGARWEIAEPPVAPESYRLVLPHGSVAMPVTRVLDRLAGRRPSPLSDYVARLASGRFSTPG